MAPRSPGCCTRPGCACVRVCVHAREVGEEDPGASQHKGQPPAGSCCSWGCPLPSARCWGAACELTGATASSFSSQGRRAGLPSALLLPGWLTPMEQAGSRGSGHTPAPHPYRLGILRTSLGTRVSGSSHPGRDVSGRPAAGVWQSPAGSGGDVPRVLILSDVSCLVGLCL